MRDRFNEKLHQIEISPIVRISEEARKLKPAYEAKTGRPFLLFQRGELSFSTPVQIIKAIYQAMKEGKTRYPETGGELEPKQAILRKVKTKNKIRDLDLENIVLTYGGQEALQLSFHLFEGEKVAGFSPTWSLILENLVPYSNLSFLEVPLNDDLSVNYPALERSVKGASAFYFNNPHNPTGKVFNEEELTQIGELCKKYGTFIISDEAYEDIIYGSNPHISLASLPELENYEDIVTAFTFSKSFAMTGFRLGYAVTKNKIVAELLRKGDYTQTAAVVTPNQYAALVAFESQVEEEVKQRVKELKERRDKLYDGLKEIEGLEVVKPEGAFYIFPRFSRFIPKKLEGRERDWYLYNLFKENGMAVVPGNCFSKEGYWPDNIRFSFSATPIEDIREGTERMKAIFKKATL